MTENSKLFSLISSVAAENTNMNYDSIMSDINQDESDRRKTQHELVSSLESSYGRLAISEDVEHHVQGMLSNITDGQFKQYLNKPPIDMDDGANEITAVERNKNFQFFNSQIEHFMKNGTNALNVMENIQTKYFIQQELEDVELAKSSLNSLMQSLERLKSMHNSMAQPRLLEEVNRNIAFENDMKEVCDKMNDFNQFVKAKLNIERFCKNADRKDTPDQNKASEVPGVISTLLKDVENALLQDSNN
ncbi:uncharacterized protein LOC143923140 [Arctopsyche grandis]|uniref:uncharacterized protein LOC143923140 n=1 Tax=Arctopsyche grandis TaxID=121162 RepID=UPI00406D8684